MAFVGLACPIFYFYPVNDDDYDRDFALSLRSWLKVPWDVIMFVLLPPLLFDAAFHVKFHVFLKWVLISRMLARMTGGGDYSLKLCSDCLPPPPL